MTKNKIIIVKLSYNCSEVDVIEQELIACKAQPDKSIIVILVVKVTLNSLAAVCISSLKDVVSFYSSYYFV